MRLFFLSILFPLFSFITVAQSTYQEEEMLPKYMTEQELQQLYHPDAPTTERGLRSDGSCEGYCGGQSSSGCWCDPDCIAEGDCCADYFDFCMQEPNFLEMPKQMWVPAEFEEVQAVMIRWPTSNNNAYRKLYTKLADAIQQEAEVWIVYSGDTATVHQMMEEEDMELYNHRFLDFPSNSIWIRDYGPWGFYHGEDDSLAFIDMQYYPGRPEDNAIPSHLAESMETDNYAMNLYQEGGNIMVDGFGKAYHSTGTYDRNPIWSDSLVDQYKKQTFNLHEIIVPERLNCDGGTGHIDMYAKLLNENTILVTEYPEAVTAPDKDIISENIENHFAPAISTYGEPMRIVRSPVPHRNDGSLTTSCFLINADARGYVNGVFVNRTFIMPIYSNENSGDREQDSLAIAYYESILPGYNIVPIDARLLTPMGGAIHCITMQIPAFNPIRFWHPPIEGLQSNKPFYRFTAKISNQSGINEARIVWRIQGETDWNELELSESLGADENRESHLANLFNQDFTTADTIEYYLYAKSHNGKEMTKPIVAPEGYYRFWFDEDFLFTSTERNIGLEKYLNLSVYPNPANNQINLAFEYTGNKQLFLEITDVTGRIVHTQDLPLQLHLHKSIDVNNWASGVYFLRISDGNAVYTSRFSKM